MGVGSANRERRKQFGGVPLKGMAMKKAQPKLIKLRDSAEMFHCLLKVDNCQHLQDKFYPHLLALANASMTADQAAEMLVQAIREYREDHGEVLIARALVRRGTIYLSAMIEDDREVMRARSCFNTFLAMAFFPQPAYS